MYVYLFGPLLSILFSMYLGSCPIQFYILPGELGALVTSFSCFWQRLMLLFPFISDLYAFPCHIYAGIGEIWWKRKEKSGGNNSESRKMNLEYSACWASSFLCQASVKGSGSLLPWVKGLPGIPRKSSPHGALSENYVNGWLRLIGSSWIQQGENLFSYYILQTKRTGSLTLLDLASPECGFRGGDCRGRPAFNLSCLCLGWWLALERSQPSLQPPRASARVSFLTLDFIWTLS